jgi:hypothetical protein
VKRWWAAYLLLGAAVFAVHFHLARTAGPSPSPSFLLGHFGVAFLLYLAGLRAARRLGEAGHRASLLWAFGISAAVLAAYLTAPFLLSPEVHRYRWDGKVAEAGWNPYQVSPDDPELAGLRSTMDQPIPDPEEKGLYPPLAELVFYGLARWGHDSLFHYRLLTSIFTLLSGLMFLPLCRTMGVPVTRVTVLLWNPLLLMEAGVNAHIEPLGIFFLLASLALLVRRHQLSPTGFLALATLVRGYPIALLPLYVRRVPPYRLLLFFLVLLAGSLPFIGAGRELVTGVREFLATARVNPGPFLLIEAAAKAVGRADWARPIAALLGFGIAGWIYFTDDGTGASILRRGFYLALPPLVLGPVIHPWSMLWLLPFVALADREHPLRMAGLLLTGTVALVYAFPPGSDLPGIVPLLEFGPAFLLAGWGLWRHTRRRAAA